MRNEYIIMGNPGHIAIIMDGNGRWAKKRNLPKIMGHRSGVEAVDTITEYCAQAGISALTLYTFSSENWKRPEKEVSAIMKLLEKSLEKYAGKLSKNNVRFNVIGRIEELPGSLNSRLEKLVKETSVNTGMILTLALNYGSRQEIIDAVRGLCHDVCLNGKDISSVSEGEFEKYLYTGSLPELDLIIRTSGEMRLSNFLLWQAAYAELYVTETLWPDFDAEEMDRALEEFSKRERRFGE